MSGKELHWRTAGGDIKYRPMEVYITNPDLDKGVIWHKMARNLNTEAKDYRFIPQAISAAQDLGLTPASILDFKPNTYYLIDTYHTWSTKNNFHVFVWLDGATAVTKAQAVGMNRFRELFGSLMGNDTERYTWVPDFLQQRILNAPGEWKTYAHVWLECVRGHKDRMKIKEYEFKIVLEHHMKHAGAAIQLEENRREQEAITAELLGLDDED